MTASGLRSSWDASRTKRRWDAIAPSIGPSTRPAIIHPTSRLPTNSAPTEANEATRSRSSVRCATRASASSVAAATCWSVPDDSRPASAAVRVWVVVVSTSTASDRTR